MLQEKFVRFQLNLFKPFLSSCSLETTREGQDKLGQLLTIIHQSGMTFEACRPGDSEGMMIIPRDELSGGVILYLHGGGYTCGDMQYAKGFGTTLAAKCGIRVFCSAYRLAPEAPFPAAVEDALSAWRHLLTLGYKPEEILLCGESAGGGLCFSLCLRLKELDYAMPAGIVAISPWTDLTLSGDSFRSNREADPSLTEKQLKFYADCYAHGDAGGITDETADREKKRNPLVSPLYGDLSGLPPVLSFVGGDEILLDDTRLMHEALKKAGVSSQLVIRDGMWHAYVLYCLKENEGDFDSINRFLKNTLSRQKKLHWMRLDNAAKIYPAAKTRRWSNFFRLSVNLTEEIDREVLKSALDVTIRRFPSIAVRLRHGAFWYYLEELPQAPELTEEGSYPLVRRPFDDIRRCAFRVIPYGNRLAVEFFHAITDGSGGLIFIKTLAAEYLSQRHSIVIPGTHGVLDRLELPRDSELEDSFLKCGGKITASRKERTAYRITGTPEPDGYCTNTCFQLNAAAVIQAAKKAGYTVTTYLAAALMQAAIAMQEKAVPNPRRRRDVRILLPVNLRRLFPSETLRNFALYVTPGVDVRLGEYTFDELCRIIHHEMGLQITQKELRKRIATNVNAEQVPLLKIAPLFIKNAVMKAVFNAVGERKSCFSFSNLGVVTLPEEMRSYVSRMDFVLGVQARAPYNVGALTYDDTMFIHFIRNIREPYLEHEFYTVLHELGFAVKVSSNQREEEKEN